MYIDAYSYIRSIQLLDFQDRIGSAYLIEPNLQNLDQTF